MSGTTLTPQPVICTERLVLRRPRLDDAQAIFEGYASRADVVRYLRWRPHESVEDTRQFLRFVGAAWDRGDEFSYAICLAQEDAPIGMIGIHPAGTRVVFGYVIGPSHWGQGYTAEALSVLVEWSLAQEGIWRAGAYCDIENPASGRVMEKAGMTYEGILKRWSVHPNVAQEPRDCLSYSKVR
ncbi:GNAT family N-acetyltransferase [Microvirga puerhi]|uniref:GNAT family N-acetyltransferase n=1 Tax=Microvirga puerhi TaxID=2876078 RepID=A0ABS7VQ41_9HYPH|nr:GNAT family N-acetyltransferase [Microvirga puerhi]MBZ6077033.1 GNAT family N-acetyltransferase [Microvirga puerhi]